jgi:hypothetical protein
MLLEGLATPGTFKVPQAADQAPNLDSPLFVGAPLPWATRGLALLTTCHVVAVRGKRC